MILAGTSKRNIARAFGCGHALWTRYQQTGSTADRQRPGFPGITTPREDRLIRLTRLRNGYFSVVMFLKRLYGTAYVPIIYVLCET